MVGVQVILRAAIPFVSGFAEEFQMTSCETLFDCWQSLPPRKMTGDLVKDHFLKAGCVVDHCHVHVVVDDLTI